MGSDLPGLFAYPFMVNAFVAGAIVAVMAATTGWFMVLRRETFAGHTLTVMSFPGAATAAIAGAPLALGALGASAAAAATIAVAGRGRTPRGRDSALVGAVQVGGFGLGLLLLSRHNGLLAGLHGMLFGSFLTISREDVGLLALAGCGTLLFLLVAGRPLLHVSIDPTLARARGVRVSAIEAGYLVALALSVSAAAQITGVLLVFALLVAPAAAAQVMSANPAISLALSTALAVATVWGGLTLSYYTDHPAGFFITTIAFAVYLGALATRRARGRRR